MSLKLQNIKILVVDDEDDLRAGVNEYLSSHGAEVTEAESGEAGLAYLAKNTVDLVVSDVRMPDGDGYFLISELNKLELSKKPKVIFFSGYSDIAHSKLLEAGAEAILEKPLSMRALVKRISDLLI